MAEIGCVHDKDSFFSMFKDISIYVTDGRGYTLGVSKVYESLTGLEVEEVLGHYMGELEEKGVIDRSASLLVIKERKTITIEQKILRTGKKIIVTSNPVFNQEGKIVLVASALYPCKEQYRSPEIKENNNVNLFTLPSLEGVIATSKAMQEVLLRTVRASMVDSTVLISGESGVGKEVIARIIHQLSFRRNKPFIKVNIASIPEELFESELFGYRGGAFTGALKYGKKGLVEAAEGGTIFLDEISEIPPSLQVKLLRLIQEREVLPVGSTVTKKVDVRFLAATNRDLQSMVEKGQFRDDLFYRLNVLPIYIPPLRERKDDICSLALYFWDGLCKKYKTRKELSSSALAALVSYNWPGNIRELQNVIERLFVLSSSQTITAQQVFDEINTKFRERNEFDGFPILQNNLKKTVEIFEQDIINRILKQCHGDVEQAAKALGIHRTTLLRKLRRYSVSQ